MEVNTPEEAAPFVVHRVSPDYPLDARRRRLTGVGLVVGEVDRKTGNVVAVRMQKSTGHQILDDAVLHAFRQWRFTPKTIRKFRFPVKYTMLNRRP